MHLLYCVYHTQVQLHKLILGNELVDPLVVTVIKMVIHVCSVLWIYIRIHAYYVHASFHDVYVVCVCMHRHCLSVVLNVLLCYLQLLSACCDQDLHIRKLLGECLGELGAIDPRRYH